MSKRILSKDPRTLVELWLVSRPHTFDAAGEAVGVFKEGWRMLPSRFPNISVVYKCMLKLKMQREHLDEAKALFYEYRKFENDFKYGSDVRVVHSQKQMDERDKRDRMLDLRARRQAAPDLT